MVYFSFMWFGFEYIAHLLRDPRNIIYFHKKNRRKKRKSKLLQVFSWRALLALYMYFFPIWTREKCYATFVKSAKKRKTQQIFFKDTPESFVATSNSLKPFYKKNSEKDAMCSSMWWNRQYVPKYVLGHLQIFFNLIYIYALLVDYTSSVY